MASQFTLGEWRRPKPVALTISMEGGVFTADDRSRPGTPLVGRARTVSGALGEWLRNNQSLLGLAINLDESAQPAEKRRRARELRKR